MKAGHSHVQKNGRGGGRYLIQGILTQTKNITDHDHVQMIQGIFTHTKSITDREHHHIQKPEAVTVTCTQDFIHQILCRQNISQDHYPDCQYVHGKTVTNIQTLPQKNHVRLHNLNRHPIHSREKLTNIDAIPQRSHVRDHDPIHSREKLANVETLPQRSNV